MIFETGPVEMGCEVGVRRDTKAKAGFTLWAVGGEAGAGIARSRTHSSRTDVEANQASEAG